MSRPFYGWAIVAVAFCLHFAVSGCVYYAFGVLFKPISQELAAGARTGVGSVLPLLNVVVGLSGPFVGRALDGRGIRRMLLAGVALLSLGFLALSQVRSLFELFLSYAILIAGGTALAGNLPCSTLVSNWFVRRRGRALGVAQLGISLSGVSMVWVASALVEFVGWRGAAAGFAAFSAALLLPLVALFAVDRPEARGLHPDGLAALSGSDPAAAAEAAPRDTRALLRDPRLWILSICIGVCASATGTLVQQIHAFATDLGHALLEVTSVLSLLALGSALGKPVFGLFADRSGGRAALAGCLAIQLAGVACLLAVEGLGALRAAAALFGLGMGGLMPVWGHLVGSVFGRASFGRSMGLMGLVMLPLQVAGGPLAAWIHDRTGSYRPAFAIFIAMYLVALGLLARLDGEGTRGPGRFGSADSGASG